MLIKLLTVCCMFDDTFCIHFVHIQTIYITNFNLANSANSNLTSTVQNKKLALFYQLIMMIHNDSINLTSSASLDW